MKNILRTALYAITAMLLCANLYAYDSTNFKTINPNFRTIGIVSPNLMLGYADTNIISIDKEYNIDTVCNLPELGIKYLQHIEMKKLNDSIYWVALSEAAVGGFDLDCMCHKYYKDDVVRGFLVLKIDAENKKYEVVNYYSQDNIKNFSYTIATGDTSVVLGINGFCFDKTGEYVYFISDATSFAKIKTNNPDSIEYHAKLNTSHIGSPSVFLSNYYRILQMDDDEKIWFLSAAAQELHCFDTKSETFEHYRLNEDFKDSLFVVTGLLTYSSAQYNNELFMTGYSKLFGDIASAYDYDFKMTIQTFQNHLLHYNKNTNQWDTIFIPQELFSRTIEGKEVNNAYLFHNIFKWSNNEIAIRVLDMFSMGNSKWSQYNKHAIMIYNIETEIWQKIVPPIFDKTTTYAGRIPPALAKVHYWNDKHYLNFDDLTSLVLYENTDGIEETEAGAIPDLWFRYVYPNPTVPTRQVTANIMCYLADVRDVELGLYNFIGQKILDLTNQFEYSEATHTINLTFDIPKELSRGIYFLNVRNGDETRTKTIIVVGE